MRAMQVFTDGSPSQKVEVATPTPAANQVRVKVSFAALDTGTEAVLSRDFNATFIHDTKITPLIIGWHYAGTIDEVGTSVENLKVGDEVFGFLDYDPKQQQGSFSEYIVVQETKTCLKPSSVSFEIAAASSCECLTALQAMRDDGGLNGGDSILILGSSGGVGSAAIQIAKNLGAHVTAVCSTKHVDRVKNMGADSVVDRTTDPNYLESLKDKKFNVIFDVPNTTSWWETKGLLEKNGSYVVTLPSVPFVRDTILSLVSSTSVKFVACKPVQEDFKLAGEWMENGTLKIDVDSQYKISELDKAIEKQKDTSKIGRVVIQVDNGWE